MPDWPTAFVVEWPSPYPIRTPRYSRLQLTRGMTAGWGGHSDGTHGGHVLEGKRLVDTCSIKLFLVGAELIGMCS